MAEAGFPATVNLATGSGARSATRSGAARRPCNPAYWQRARPAGGPRSWRARRLKRLSPRARRQERHRGLADADLDFAADGIVWSAFGTTGQRCTAASRVIVERPVVGDLLERLERRTKALRLGSGLDSATDVDRWSMPAPSPRCPATSTSAGVTESWSPVAIGRAEPDSSTAISSSRRSSRAFLVDGPDRPGGDLRAGPVGDRS